MAIHLEQPTQGPTASSSGQSSSLGEPGRSGESNSSGVPGTWHPGANQIAEPQTGTSDLMKSWLSQLGEFFRTAGFTGTGVLELIGEQGQLGLARNSTVPVARALAGTVDTRSFLTALFMLQRPIPLARAEAILPLPLLLNTGLARVEGDQVAPMVSVRPYLSPDDGASGWLVSDLLPNLDGEDTKTRPDYVLGASPASTTLAQMVIRRPVGSALDLGTGCGVQSLHLAKHCRQVVATDINRRALRLARMSSALSGVEVDFRLGSIFEPVAGETFDLIVTNPPYVISPPKSAAERLTYRESGYVGDGIVETIVREASGYLNPGGILQILGNWAITRDEDGEPAWRERVMSWVPDDCDASFIQREELSPYEYVEMWLADAGLSGGPQWVPEYTKWLDYFDQLGICAVGMGWIELQKHSGQQRHHVVTAEKWQWAVAQPVSTGFERLQLGRQYNLLSDTELLARRWTLADDVVEETSGKPGELDPATIVYRQRTGFCRAIKVSTGLGGVLGACDGELALGDIMDAVAKLLGIPLSELSTEVMFGVRQAINCGMLTQPGC